MRFEVPQFIEIEDKIFGPFTWKQFVYLMGGVGFGIVLFIIAPFIIFVILGLPVAGLAILLAFYPVNNRPFSVFLEAFITFYNTHQIYHWRKQEHNVYTKTAETEPAPVTTFAPPPSGKKGIHSLSRQLELKAIQKQQ
jgi:hypothetical protein